MHDSIDNVRDPASPAARIENGGAYWRAFTQHTSHRITVLDDTGTILFSSHAIADHEDTDSIGTSYYAYLGENAARIARKQYQQVFATGDTACFDITTTDATGESHIIENRVYPVKDNERTIAIINDAHDVTQSRRRQQHLEHKHILLDTVVSQLPIIIWAIDDKGIFTLSEGSALGQLGFSPGQVVGMSVFDLYKDNPDVIEHCQQALRGDTLNKVVEAGGRIYHASYNPVRDEDGNINGVIGVANDITDLEKVEAQMRILSSALEQTAELVLITDADGIIEYVNPAFTKTTGYRREDVIGKKPAMLRSGKHEPEFYQRLWETILRGEVFNDVFINARKDGSIYYEEKYITPIRDQRNHITHFISTGNDISERMRVQERLHYMAHHDALTKLPNRNLFLDRLRQAMARARWHKRLIAVMFLDLDRFKTINDSLGHQVGDQLIVQLTQRLSSGVRAGDTIARFGGDEFAILLDDIASEKDISQLAKKVLDTMVPTFVIEGRELYITASIGVSIFPNDGEDSETLLRNADVAMYRAKELGRNNYQFYSNEMSARAFERLTLENSLRHALKRMEFSLLYQPQMEIRTRRIVGVEALLRWQHPELGQILPGDFIPLLEETGLIIEVGDWVLKSALQQAAQWHHAGYDFLKMSINLSGRQFNNPDFITALQSTIQNAGVDPKTIELELTESMLMRNASKTISALNTLHQLGVTIAVDDFGTGYSSLNYLRRFPISTLKIDRSFLRDVIEDSDDRAITTAIIVMAQSLNLIVVAEGVETEEQLIFLQSLDCHQVQGNLCSSPVDASVISRLLRAQEGK
ncbi:MAG: EAL domain-containing protein [Gammaproteobacteria bacterium]|nr:EAL domain-containing protein [Gammaproteobacteria bacterium]